METRLRGAFETDSGMHGIWDLAAFSHVLGYDTWEAELLEDSDIERHIEAGHFVPIYIHSDGVVEIELRVGASNRRAALSERERAHLVAISEAYLLRSTGRLCVSGIDFVHAQPDEAVGLLALKPGDYSVTVHLIAWDDEPGMKDGAGCPKDDALPDFVVLINPPTMGENFRSSVETFARPTNH